MSDQITIEKKKDLGAYYTPKNVADYLAKVLMSFAKLEKDKKYVVLDPATGDSALLIALMNVLKRKSSNVVYFGLDIDKEAISQSKENTSAWNVSTCFINTDALYPYKFKKAKTGWDKLKKKHFPDGVDFIVCNPPWGTSTEKYASLSSEFETAIGQYDVFDLFIETAIANLNEGGYYAFIVPDSIYSQEHKPIRKLLFSQTTIVKIARIGEGFFSDANIAVSLIFGKKTQSKRYKVKCTHLPHEIKKKVLQNEMSLIEADSAYEHKTPVNTMIEDNYSFLTDIEETDERLIQKLKLLPKTGDFVNSYRGVELSKKGVVLLCPNCNNWFPRPKTVQESIRCPLCSSYTNSNRFTSKTIISAQKNRNYERIIVGENIFRYIASPKCYILNNCKGINYNSKDIYCGTKIVIRKTGVGITAAIDYQNCYTNQVVYIVKKKENLSQNITNEVVLSIINSRIITYYLLKAKGNSSWKSHPYISQADVESLPFPRLDLLDEKTISRLRLLTQLVKDNSVGDSDSFSKSADAEIERMVADLFGFGIDDYKVIYKALQDAQQMIPFKRLLNISVEEIFQNGL